LLELVQQLDLRHPTLVLGPHFRQLLICRLGLAIHTALPPLHLIKILLARANGLELQTYPLFVGRELRKRGRKLGEEVGRVAEDVTEIVALAHSPILQRLGAFSHLTR
jgi:hypothetical protein